MAVAVHNGLKPSSGSQRCRLQTFTHLDYTLTVLKKNNLAHSSNQASEPLIFHRCFSTPCLSLGTKVDEEYDVNPRIEILGGSRASDVRALVVEVAIAIASGVNPIPVSGGLGGVYYMHGRNGRKVAIAKPVDEEPLAFNNPKGFGGLMLGQPGLKRSVRIGETGVRELAAFLLDHDGFSGVPPTALVKICHVPFHVNNTSAVPTSNYKIASLQRFMDHDFDAGEMGPSCFSVASVHKIGILDVRLLNLDRHSGNILAKKSASDTPVAGSIELVPIDHGLCLPEWIDDPYFEWLHWPQAAVPFSESECEYISSLDPFKDAELLRNDLHSIRESSIRVHILCTILLKSTVEAGLCLADIGEMMTRSFSGGEEKCSVLEELCLQCKASLPVEMSGCKDKAEEAHDETMQFEMETEYCPPREMVGLLEYQDTHQGIFKPSKFLRLSSLRSLSGIPDLPLSSICERDDDIHASGELDSTVADMDDHKMAIMNRSMSFSVPQHMNECEGTSFGDMSEDEWGLFLENFEKVLPQVIEDTKCKGLKQRLGTSCEFSAQRLTSPKLPMTTTVTITDHEIPDETHNLYTVTVSVSSAGDPAPSSATTNIFTCLLTNSPTHLTDWLAALPLPPSSPNKTVVGFDVEWRPNTSTRDDHPIATVQLHLLETHSVVFQIIHSPSIPKALIEFLNDERLVFVGVGIKEDVEKLLCDYGLSVKAEARDLRIGEGTKGLGLAGLAKKVLGMDVVKNKRVGMGRWDMLWLNSNQVKYACLDAFLSWKIGEALLNG